MSKITSFDKNKIGNAIIYIAEKVTLLSKTKLLKLLYLMEEYSVRRFHQPFLGLPFELWQAGPVIKDIFIDLSQTPTILADFVTKQVLNGKTYIKPKKAFCDDEFSDNDIVVMDDIIKKYGQKTAKELVDITHDKKGLWYNECKKHNLLEVFERKEANNSNYVMDLGEQLPKCSRDFYEQQLEFLNMSRNYGV